MYAARKKFDDPRIALVESNGAFSFRAYTGVNFTVRWDGDIEVIREVQVIYWQGATLESAAKAVT